MLRFCFLFSFLTLIVISVQGQQLQSNDVELISDSIVYEIDTVLSIDTIEHLIYGAPTHYNVIGIKYGVGKSWLDATNHQNPQMITSPELFCNFSRGRSLFSIGLQYFTIAEKVQYDVINTILHDTTFQKTDTLTRFGQIVGKDTTFTYLTEQKTFPRTDTFIIHSTNKQNTTLKMVSIPLRYGYYLTNGYLRVNAGIGIVPMFIISKQNNLDTFMLSNKKRFSLLVQPTIEVSYWLFTKIFLHFSCSYQRSVVPLVLNDGSNFHINNILASVGFSFIFFDKKRE